MNTSEKLIRGVEILRGVKSPLDYVRYAHERHADALELLAEAWEALSCGETDCPHPGCRLAARIEAFANGEKKEGE